MEAAIAAAQSEDAVKIEVLNDIQPLRHGRLRHVLRRCVRLHGRVARRAEALGRNESTLGRDRARPSRTAHEALLTAGQTSGASRDSIGRRDHPAFDGGG